MVSNPLRDHRLIVLQREASVRSKPCGPVISTLNPPRNGSAAIHPSCGPMPCLPPAIKAASMRSRRLPGMPLV